jgi:hypothetical protein
MNYRMAIHNQTCELPRRNGLVSGRYELVGYSCVAMIRLPSDAIH